MIDGVPQDRRITVNPLRGKTEFLANKLLRLTPNRGKQGGIPEKESPRIANNESDPNGDSSLFSPIGGLTLIVCSQGTQFYPVGGLLLFSYLGELH